jgi:hypothetical protein
VVAVPPTLLNQTFVNVVQLCILTVYAGAKNAAGVILVKHTFATIIKNGIVVSVINRVITVIV